MGATATAVPRAWSNGSYAAIHSPATGPMILSAGPPGLLPPGHARSVGPGLGVRTPVCPDHGSSGH
eukprot:1430840-Rhodomonas_salina.1